MAANKEMFKPTFLRQLLGRIVVVATYENSLFTRGILHDFEFGNGTRYALVQQRDGSFVAVLEVTSISIPREDET